MLLLYNDSVFFRDRPPESTVMSLEDMSHKQILLTWIINPLLLHYHHQEPFSIYGVGKSR